MNTINSYVVAIHKPLNSKTTVAIILAKLLAIYLSFSYLAIENHSHMIFINTICITILK